MTNARDLAKPMACEAAIAMAMVVRGKESRKKVKDEYRQKRITEIGCFVVVGGA